MVGTSHAQAALKPPISIYNRLNVYTTSGVDAFAFDANPAALGNVAHLSGGVYGEHRFLLTELGFYHAAVTVPSNSGTFGLSGRYFGNSLYNELHGGLAYGRKLSDKWLIGAGFRSYTIHISGYSNVTAYMAEAGLLYIISDGVQAGFHVYNPTSSYLGKDKNMYVPFVYTAGLGYQPSEKFAVATSIQKTQHENPELSAGLQYWFDEKLVAKTGFVSSGEYYMGLGFQLPALRLDATATVHPQLGITPGLQLLFARKKSGDEH